jgi:hypothetical protein
LGRALFACSFPASSIEDVVFINMGGRLSTTKYDIVRFVDEPNRGMMTLLGLQVVLEYGRQGSARPPVTAALIVANSLVYLQFGDLRRILPLNVDISFNPYRIIEVRTIPNLHSPGIMCVFIKLSPRASKFDPSICSELLKTQYFCYLYGSNSATVRLG